MKQRKPLRRTPITRKTPMPRVGKQAKRPPMVKARRQPVTPEVRRARRLVYARSEFNGVRVCELCFCRRATNYQHRKNKSQCSPDEMWVASNGIDVCGSGTTGCHGRIHSHPEEAMRYGWMVPSHLDPAVVPVFLRQYGWVLLDADGGWESVNPEALGGDAA